MLLIFMFFTFKAKNYGNSLSLLEQLNLRVPSSLRTKQKTLLEIKYFTSNYLNFAPLRAFCAKFNDLYQSLSVVLKNEVIDMNISIEASKKGLVSR